MGMTLDPLADRGERPAALVGAIPVRDRAFAPRPQRERLTLAFRVRYRFRTDDEGTYRVSPVLWEHEAVTLRNELASTEIVDFDERFPDGIEPVHGWEIEHHKDAFSSRPACMVESEPEHVTTARSLAQSMAMLVQTNPLGLIDVLASTNDWLGGLACSEYDEAVATIASIITVPVNAHSGPLHGGALHG